MNNLRLGKRSAAVLRPYTFCGERIEHGRVESKSRDLGSDCGYRVAIGRGRRRRGGGLRCRLGRVRRATLQRGMVRRIGRMTAGTVGAGRRVG